MATESEQISAQFARQWWKALMANAVALIEDGALLAEHRSPGRAQAMVVLAMEELAKARWLYDAAQWEWTAPLGLYGQTPGQLDRLRYPRGFERYADLTQRNYKSPNDSLRGLRGFGTRLAGWSTTRFPTWTRLRRRRNSAT